MVSLGGFSFDVTADTSQAIAGLNALRQAAAQTAAAINQSLSGGGVARINTAAATQGLGQITAAAKATQTAVSFTATPQVNTAPAKAELTQLQQFGASVFRGLIQGTGIGSGFLFGAGAGAGAIASLGIATAVSNVTGAMLGGIRAGVAYTAQIELASNTLKLFTGSAQRADAALGFLRRYADNTIFDTEEVIAAGRVFVSVADGNIAKLRQLIELTGQLAATNPSAPGAGFEGATVAIRELLSGDTTSVAERFNVSRSALAEAKAQGQTGVELVQTAIKLAGGSAALVEAQGKTLVGQLSNFNSAVAEAQRLATSGFATVIGAQLPAATKAVRDSATSWAVLGAALAGIPAAAIAAVDALNAANSTAAGIANVPRGPRFDPNNPLVELPPLGALESQTPLNLPRRGAGDPASLRETLASEKQLVEGVKTLSAEQIKVEEERQKKIIAIRKEALGDIAGAFREEAALAKANETTQKTSINEVRDAAIKAASERRDSAIAGLDAEQSATSRRRTLQDRAIESGNEATLRGLEAAHNLTLKGLDEQLAAIQKRGDATLKGLDEELRAVDRKRDAAIRALDDEARAEDRRHDQAVRNIDRERDRRLGIIDAQLDALDAAAQRDQRRQTDTSQRRTLVDARQDLRNAETPEQRARARRAIADAEAAIAREQVNRQREDARAALRAQADQIRAAADLQKQAEAERTAATREGLDARKLAAQDQARADAERLNGLKERVKTETDIEAQSIRDRTAAENEGYQAAVRAQQDAFKQQQQQLDDQRYYEDQAIAARRSAVQTAYTADTDNAKASADAQIKDQEEITRATLAEIDKRKAAAERAVLPPVPIAPSIPVGVPPRSAGPSQTMGTGEGDSTYGPFDPVNYGLPDLSGIVEAGNAAVAAYAGAVASPASQATVQQALIDAFTAPVPSGDQIVQALGGIAAEISNGLIGALNAGSDTLTTGVEAWVQKSVIQPARDALGIASPSTVFKAMAEEVPPGFVQGLAGADAIIGPAIVAVFDDAWARYLAPWFTGGNGLQTQLGVHFARAARGLNSPTTQRAVGDAMRVAINTGLNLALSRQDVWWDLFEDLGRTLALSAGIGWLQQWRETPLSMPAIPSLGTGAETRSLREPTGSSGGFQSFLLSPSAPVATSSFGGGAWPSGLFPTHALGGFAAAGRMALFGELGMEFGFPAQAGSVLPADVSRNLMAVASGQAVGSGGSRTYQFGDINIDARGVQNAEQLAAVVGPQIVREVFSLIDAVERHAPDAAPPTLGGAF